MIITAASESFVGSSAGCSWMFRDRVPRILEPEFSRPKSLLGISLKGMGIVKDLASEFGVELVMAEATHEVFAVAASSGLSFEDDSGLIRIYEGFMESDDVNSMIGRDPRSRDGVGAIGHRRTS
jgi:3-hydroxyisobutyrate dehydrogenase-like beta-hydroxyacid dehydrogenase